MDHSAEEVTRLVIQIAVILAAAKITGEVFERFLRMPAVLGELGAGIVIGPFAFGAVDLPLVGHLAGAGDFPYMGALFERVPDAERGEGIPDLYPSLWAISQIGAIVLLFMAGLETNLRQFLRYAKPASLVALGGVALPFAFGVGLPVAMGYADGFGDVKALFIGAALTATSIGITVRVLNDLKPARLDSPEGVTILGAAVLDDVIGILILTIVVGLAETGEMSAGSIGLVAGKAVGFWLGLTAIGILLSGHISRFFEKFQVSGAAVALSLALALLAAGLAEEFGLAMIIGAFSIGLALSGTRLAHQIDAPLRAVHDALVPIFFVVMGMLVDVRVFGGVIVFGALLTLLAIIGKVAGSGLPALLAGFNLRGGLRVGIGMLPRGEVALIMAGIGVSRGILDADLYGVVILMTIITTAMAPPILQLLFRSDEPGVRASAPSRSEDDG